MRITCSIHIEKAREIRRPCPSPCPIDMSVDKKLVLAHDAAPLPHMRPERARGKRIIRVAAVSLLALVCWIVFAPSQLVPCAPRHSVLERMHAALFFSALPVSPCKMHSHTVQFSKRAEDILAGVPSAKSARAALQRYTREHHLAGERLDYTSAVRTVREWSSALGLPNTFPERHFHDAGSPESQANQRMRRSPHDPHAGVHVWADTYSVWLDQPLSASLSLAPSAGEAPTWTADLRERVLREDPTSGSGLPPFHGFSHSGNGTGHVVYAGLGRREDFVRLRELGVDFRGTIVLVRYGGLFRGLKVRLAQEHGAAGVLIYTDPLEDGDMTQENGFKPYPYGPAREPSSIQRGSVQALSFYPGDPATPGAPSYRNASRLDREEADSMPRIPSLPISYPNARRILESIAGHAIPAHEVSDTFAGGVPGVEYWTGPSADVATLVNKMDLKTRDIWNVYAVIPGEIDDERVYVGNHRDAWVFGATDPSSGSAVLHETIRAFGTLLRTGWRPLRTIVFASWDAEEYGLIGSTEFGEDFADFLVENAAIYHNLDVAVSGSLLEGRASPSLAPHLHHAAADTAAPSGNGTLSFGNIEALGSGSDFTVFLQRLGIASTDFSFRATRHDPVYHYHSNYDSFYWMDNFGDPGFVRHEALARLIALVTLRSSQSAILPLDVSFYANELYTYEKRVLAAAAASGANLTEVPVADLHAAIGRVAKAAAALTEQAGTASEALAQVLATQSPRSRCPPLASQKLTALLADIRALNRRMISFEQGFIDEGGLRGREWYRHLGVAPGRWLGYGATTFPGALEAFSLDGGRGARHEIKRLVRALDHIAESLST